MLTKKPEQMKKVFCFDICSCHYLRQSLSTSDLSFSQVTSVEQREPRKHFSASAYGLGFKNFFLGTLCSTSVTWEKLKSDVDKLCLRRGKNKYRNKILNFTIFYELGLSWQEKIGKVRKELSKDQFDATVVTALDEIAWLFNLRGNDVPYNPVFR